MALGDQPAVPTPIRRLTDREIADQLQAWAGLYPRDNAPDSRMLPYVVEAARRLGASDRATVPGYEVDCSKGNHAWGKDNVCTECQIHRSEVSTG